MENQLLLAEQTSDAGLNKTSNSHCPHSSGRLKIIKFQLMQMDQLWKSPKLLFRLRQLHIRKSAAPLGHCTQYTMQREFRLAAGYHVHV